MLSKAEFIDFILNGGDKETAVATQAATDSALPDGFEGFEGFDTVEIPAPSPQPGSSFARRLLEASGFGYPEMVQRENVIRSTDPVARYLPMRVSFWPMTTSRPYQTILFEADLNHKKVLDVPAFKSSKINHLEDVESALARMVSEALDGFQRGGEGVTADVRKGRKEETLCVVSILDERDAQPGRLVCFGTQNEKTSGLETFQITEQTRLWDGQLAREHLDLLYERQFKKLESKDWQEAFTTTEERKQADRLLEVCTRATLSEGDIQECVIDLLDTIAKGFGLKKPANRRRLQAFALPSDHDIGINPEDREKIFGGKNPFGGVTLRDERSRLLGYIVYPLKNKDDAARLHRHLAEHNRFHNVLVVYPDKDQASIELWQGREQLTGKLRKGQGYKDAADVVNLLSRFFVVSKAKVRNPTELAQELAYRARYLRRLAVIELHEEQENGPLRNLYNAFKEALVHDQTEEDFADAFAQTITYGLLTARWVGNDQLVANDERLTRQTALKHLSAASPFLNDLFTSALSVKLDEQRGRLLWLVDDIADLLDRINVTYVFGAGDKGSDAETDPVIHFYEPFLAAYDKDLKNKRGVFFTPRPVVSYIVRGVHELLREEFGLRDGLASTDTWGDVSKRIAGMQIPEGVKASDPFVCILDPATGTGTFLFECIDIIESTMKDRWCQELGKKDWKDRVVVARWNEYVPKYLLPRLFGYELMMASYAVAHLKLWFKLQQSGYTSVTHKDSKLHVYLTNSLEPATDVQLDLEGFSPALAHEARAVNTLKRVHRYSVVLGNPPYSVTSFNQNAFIDLLMGDYKKHLKGEQGLVALSDDYLKFIRLSQELLRKTGAGIWGMITNHGYLRGVIHRGVRRELLNHFRTLTILDLHGDSNVGEKPPAGFANENVFDIQQGVCIAICSQVPASAETKNVRHADCWGSRLEKYYDLTRRNLSGADWTALQPREPSFFLIPFDDTNLDEYQSFPALTDLMPVNSCGVKTHRDAFLIDMSRSDLMDRFKDVAHETNLAAIRERYSIKDTPHWRLKDAREKIAVSDVGEFIKPITYRPFDNRWIYYNPAIIEKGDSKYPTLRHMLHKNVALIAARIQAAGACNAVFVSRSLVEMKTGEATRSCTVFPLYLVSDENARQRDLAALERRPNLNNVVLRDIADRLGAKAIGPYDLPEKVTPEDILHYVYAILHSPGYRKRYSEFLRSEFPRIPFGTKTLFLELSALGKELVAVHLLEAAAPESSTLQRVGVVQREVEKIKWSDNTVWIDKRSTCGFAGVSEDVWLFEVGGYQVCEKWLRSRKGLTLTTADVIHYERIIGALKETIRLMGSIEQVIDSLGGWPGAFVTKIAGDKA
jgi:flagellar biosynthesis regulator FlbT